MGEDGPARFGTVAGACGRLDTVLSTIGCSSSRSALVAEASGGGDGSRILDLESGLHDLGHLLVMVMEPVKGLPWSERLAARGSATPSDR
ncbi:hypothetical protein ACLOJK_036571 [Asimina triloba]